MHLPTIAEIVQTLGLQEKLASAQVERAFNAIKTRALFSLATPVPNRPKLTPKIL